MNTKFTLIIPTYNESKIIKETIKLVVETFSKEIKIPWSIIVTDNASVDGTADIVDSLNDARVKSLRLKEKGRGRAIRAGFKEANGGIVGFTDADLPIHPSDIVRALNIVLNGESEIVIGNRFAKDSDTSSREWIRNLSSSIFLILAKTITGLKANDTQCPLRIMNERTTPIMFATIDNTWWSELECILLAERLGVKIKEISVIWNEKRYGARKSTVMVVRDGLKAIKAMIKIRFQIYKQLRDLRKILK